jgi:hypothetical protein
MSVHCLAQNTSPFAETPRRYGGEEQLLNQMISEIIIIEDSVKIHYFLTLNNSTMNSVGYPQGSSPDDDLPPGSPNGGGKAVVISRRNVAERLLIGKQRGSTPRFFTSGGYVNEAGTFSLWAGRILGND